MGRSRKNGGPLPLGNARPGRRVVFATDRAARPVDFPGAGQRIPQAETRSGSPPNTLPSRFGATGLKAFLGGRTSVGRSFQTFSDRRITPFFIDTPTGFEAGQRTDEGFVPEASDVPKTDRGRPTGGGRSGKVQKVKLAQLLKNPKTRSALRNAGFQV